MFIVFVYFVFIFLFILRKFIITRKLYSSQKFKNFQDKFNLIEQNKRSFKFIIAFYRLRINKKCFATIEIRI
jgi:hypothetical protein